MLTPADEVYHISKHGFKIPSVCGCRNSGEALRRIGEGAAMIRTKGEAGTGDVVEAVRHARTVLGDIRRLQLMPEEELMKIKELSLSVDGVLGVHQLRTRMSGPVRFIQLHLELGDTIPLIEAHRISDQVEMLLMDHFEQADVLIHQDPLSVVLDAEKEQKQNDW